MEESVISVMFFIIFGIASVVGKVLKKDSKNQPQRTGTNPQGAQRQTTKSNALKDLISSIEGELSGQPVVKQVERKPVINQQRVMPSQSELENDYKSAKRDNINDKVVVQKNNKIVISQSELKRAFVMKEILDRPLSLR